MNDEVAEEYGGDGGTSIGAFERDQQSVFAAEIEDSNLNYLHDEEPGRLGIDADDAAADDHDDHDDHDDDEVAEDGSDLNGNNAADKAHSPSKSGKKALDEVKSPMHLRLIEALQTATDLDSMHIVVENQSYWYKQRKK